MKRYMRLCLDKARSAAARAKNENGFTLVELIVVIAILGILAGIGTVGYSGYIKKANMAADQILLDSLNTAFAAACIENGVDINDISNATVDDLSDKKVSGITSVTGAEVDSTKESAIISSFADYFAGNENGEFKVATSLRFDAAKKLFIDPANTTGSIALSYGNGTVYLNSADIANLAASTFYTASGLGVDGLLDKVNEVAGFAGAADSDAFNAILGDENYRKSLAKYLGVPNASSLSGNELATAIEARLAELEIDDETELQNVVVNGTVLYASEYAQQQSQDDIFAMLTAENPKSTIVATMNSNQGAGLAQAALAYGMYTAYAYSKNDSDLIASTEDPIAILNGLDDDGFQEYLETEQAKTDLTGYLSALNMVNDSASSSGAASSVLINGFGDQALKDLLASALAQ